MSCTLCVQTTQITYRAFANKRLVAAALCGSNKLSSCKGRACPNLSAYLRSTQPAYTLFSIALSHAKLYDFLKSTAFWKVPRLCPFVLPERAAMQMKSVERLCSDTVRAKPKCWANSGYQCHTAHQQPHIN